MKLYSLALSSKWSVPIKVSAEQVEAMRRDGYLIEEICNVVPDWVPSFLVKPWIKVQDAWNWLKITS